jgi:hypothetical protein
VGRQSDKQLGILPAWHSPEEEKEDPNVPDKLNKELRYSARTHAKIIANLFPCANYKCLQSGSNEVCKPKLQFSPWKHWLVGLPF